MYVILKTKIQCGLDQVFLDQVFLDQVDLVLPGDKVPACTCPAPHHNISQVDTIRAKIGPSKCAAIFEAGETQVNHQACTERSLRVHGLFTERAQSVHGACTESSRSIHGACTELAQSVHGKKFAR